MGGGGGGSGGMGGGGNVIVPLGPSAYRQFSDSPFATGTPSGYFYLEDFEDKLLDTPGVTSKYGVPSSSYGIPSLVDSVDGDDQNPVNNSCSGCDAYFNINGLQGVEFIFDKAGLIRFPTHVGIVFTDAAATADIVFTAFDENDNVLASITGTGIADQTNNTSCDEDRFFGVIAPQGVRRISFYSTAGGIEADHLQYGVLSD